MNTIWVYPVELSRSMAYLTSALKILKALKTLKVTIFSRPTFIRLISRDSFHYSLIRKKCPCNMQGHLFICNCPITIPQRGPANYEKSASNDAVMIKKAELLRTVSLRPVRRRCLIVSDVVIPERSNVQYVAYQTESLETNFLSYK